ncbi:hypothetical protein LTS10_003935 [Elasticomyces elasticus]|nr:hypothetical protein LTS10_003935 [Elasticomyces elasticus]
METISSTEYYKTGGVEYYITRGNSTTGETIATIDNCWGDFTDCARHCNAYNDCGAWTWTPSDVCDLKAGRQSLAPNLDGKHYVAGLRGGGSSNASYTITTNATTSTNMTAAATLNPTIALTGMNSTAVPTGPDLVTIWWAMCCVVAVWPRVGDRIHDQEFIHQGRGVLPTHLEMQELHTKLKKCAEIYEPAAAECLQFYKAYEAAHSRLSDLNEPGIGPRPWRYEAPKTPYDYQKLLLPESPPARFSKSPCKGYAYTTAGFALFFTVFTCMTTVLNKIESGECFDAVLMRHFLWTAVPVAAAILLPILLWLRRNVDKVQATATNDTMVEKGAIEHDGREECSMVKAREDEWEAVRRIS